jgi:GT2 family glycosyltransferase
MTTLDLLIPTYRRPAALAVSLTSLAAQTFRDFRVVLSDQTEDGDSVLAGEVQAAIRVLQAHGQTVETHKHLPRRGMAEQRQFLLDQVTAPYALFLDDDVILEPDILARMLAAIREEDCGFVGCALIGLSFVDDVRPHEQHIEFWEGPVMPEEVSPDTPEWQRYRLHNAANLYHVQQRLGLTPDQQRKYRVAWVGGCVLYDTAKLRDVGGFSFWSELPAEHSGEDVLVQLRVMARYGGCGLIPSGVYHQELPTTVVDRRVDAPKVLRILPVRRAAARVSTPRQKRRPIRSPSTAGTG